MKSNNNPICIDYVLCSRSIIFLSGHVVGVVTFSVMLWKSRALLRPVFGGRRHLSSLLPNNPEVKGKLAVAAAFASLTSGLAYLGTKLDENDNEGYFEGYPRRIRSRYEYCQNSINDLVGYYAKPSSAKLLPDPLPEPYQRLYTLVIDLDETLVHSEFSLKTGWTTKVRPGVSHFIAYMHNFYEIVIFTQKQPHYAEPILNKIDPHNYIMYRLYQDSTTYKNGTHYKDLSFLNRDLSKVIIMDDEATVVSLNSDNAIIVPSWKTDPDDRYLFEIIPFLEMMSLSGIQDVRPILKQYHGLDIPTTFEETQRRQRALRQQQQEQKKGSALFSRGTNRSPDDMELLEYHIQRIRTAFLQEQERLHAQEPPKPQMIAPPPELAGKTIWQAMWGDNSPPKENFQPVNENDSFSGKQ
eukprot:Lithocolla_globosa_v1_NODE_686_length_3437_cov_22.345062.p1 type:complete len:411 gc:universal NODE_686_length_3437_cov_22.345062:2073-3305(+)